ncbi:MAG: FKBP-type peptidyl-prolyl cis-trans isomerase [Bacteroidales bacterium]|nr:FKBP-type peptidyl-prolyl cis-trans isomerase [Bacteroidales bacterium]
MENIYRVNLLLLLMLFPVFMTVCGQGAIPNGFNKSESGVYYKFHKKNIDVVHNASLTTPIAVEGSILTMNIKWRLVINKKDSVLNITPNPFEIKLMKSEYKGDIYEAFSKLHKGDSATFIINAEDFFMKTAKYPQLPQGVNNTSMLFFDVKLLNIESVEARQKAEKDKAEKFKSKEPGKIQVYIAKNKVTVAPTASGIYIIVQNPGAGRMIVNGDFVKINLTVSSIEGTKIFSTLDQNKPITFEYGKPFDTKGFDEAIGLMKLGSKATVVVPSSMGFGEKGRKDSGGQDIISPYSPVVYDIEILEIKTKSENEEAIKQEEAIKNETANLALFNEPSLIKQYIEANNITATPTSSGLYYIERVKGIGPKASTGKKVKVHYTGKLLNGKIFDSSLDRKPSTPFEFTLGQGQVIPGWDEGISMMSAGGKATLILPSKLAYGERGAGNDIPAYTPLIFDVELINVN